jgi:hypothetical protein
MTTTSTIAMRSTPSSSLIASSATPSVCGYAASIHDMRDFVHCDKGSAVALRRDLYPPAFGLN